MPDTEINILPFDRGGATMREYEALNDLTNCLQAESLPDDPPVAVESRIAQWQNPPDFMRTLAWAAWCPDSATIAGNAALHLFELTENRHLARLSLGVRPECRRLGIGKRLLAEAAACAHRANRRLMLVMTNERVPAGEALMLRLGAERGMEAHTHQLMMASLDRSLIQKWLERGREHESEFTIGIWTGAYTDDQLEPIARLVEVMNQAPRDRLDIQNFHFTPDMLRQLDAAIIASGIERWTLWIRENRSGKLVGYTEVFWSEDQAEQVQQQNTGVFPEYRGRGFGRWLKAAMLDKILRERPDVRFVRTGNADSNAAMLRINQELGFRPYLSQCVWQVPTETVLKYVGDVSVSR